MSKDVPPPKVNDGSAKNFDVQEVKPSSLNPNMIVEEGGTIDLGKPLDPLQILERLEKMSEQREKRKMRKHITYLILALTIAWIILGLVDYLRTGNTFLLASSSATSGPVLIIMGYYFGNQLLQKYIHREPVMALYGLHHRKQNEYKTRQFKTANSIRFHNRIDGTLRGPEGENGSHYKSRSSSECPQAI